MFRLFNLFVLQGRLGNQMFQYAHSKSKDIKCCHLKSRIL